MGLGALGPGWGEGSQRSAKGAALGIVPPYIGETEVQWPGWLGPVCEPGVGAKLEAGSLRLLRGVGGRGRLEAFVRLDRDLPGWA